MGRAASRAAALQKPRVILALLLLLALTSVMLLDGYLRSEIGNDSRVRDGAAYDKVPQKILDGGPILTFNNGTSKTQSVPDKTIVLTFDDGPNPTWTPQILKVLEENDVQATFFVVGSMVSRSPSVVKDLVDQGNEIGIHTFTHVDLSYQSTARLKRELVQTQLALAGAAGIQTTLFRAPYSSEINAVDNYSWPVYKEIGGPGYTSVFVDTDSDDWKQPGVSKIIKWATPEDNKGAVVLMHDAGGNRAQTVKALGTYIKTMKAKGYSFTTVSGAEAKLRSEESGNAEAVGVAQQPGQSTESGQTGQSAESGQQPPGAQGTGRNTEQAAHSEATGTTLYEGKALIVAVTVAEWVVPALAWFLAVVGVAVMGRFGMMLILARRHYRQRNKKRGKRGQFSWGPTVTRPVTVIVPAYNEKECIANTLESLAKSTHPIEIIVVDDGSTDGTSEISRSAADSSA